MRINVIDVKYLSDADMVEEYREILMSCHYYKKSAESGKGIQRNKIPEQYTLNQGHAMFFYNKMGYVKKRHDLLEAEMIERGFKTRENYSLRLDWILPQDMNDYEVTREDVYINMERILTRIGEMTAEKFKPDFYKHYGESMNYKTWCIFYQDLLNKIK